MPPSQGVSPLLWAHFRFSVLGPLLCAPPQRGALKASLEALAEKSFTHPVSGEPVKYSAVALERWYYRALHSRGDPVQALRRRSRKDFQQQKSLSQAVRSEILSLYKAYPEWTARLLFDNLLARAKEVPALPRVPSYSTVRRFLRANGLERKRVPRRGDRPGLLRAAERLESREVRSFEAESGTGIASDVRIRILAGVILGRWLGVDVGVPASLVIEGVRKGGKIGL